MTNSKAVLWYSVKALMLKHYGKENLTLLAKDCGFGPGTSSRLKDQKTSVGVEVLDKIAEHFGVQSWHLLVPGYDPNRAPTLQPLSEREAALYERWKDVAKEIIREEK